MRLSAHGHAFGSLAEVMAKANEEKSGDRLAGLAAADARERVAAKTALAGVPLRAFLEEPLLPPEADELTRAEPDQLLGDDPDRRAAHPRGLDAYRAAVHGARVAKQEPIVVDQAGSLQAAVEPAGDGRRPVRVAGDEDQRRIVARLGVEVNLRHGRSLAGRGLG